jgi:kumamolisin
MEKKSHVKLLTSKRGRDRTAFEVGKVDPKEKVTVTIALRGPELPGADEFVGQVMTRTELAKKYQASKEDVAKVKESLEKFGLKVVGYSFDRRSMRVSGTAKAMEAAFEPNWAIMSSPSQGVYRGRHGSIKIPAELRGIVKGVFGLDQRRMALRRAGPAVAVGHAAALSPFTPADIEKRYNFPPGDGEGQSIAIAQFGGGYLKDDLHAYCKRFGRQPPKVKRISVGAPAYTLKKILKIPNPDLRKFKLEQSFEVMMDAELIGGLCPKANISVYFSPDTQQGWADLLDKVIAAKPTPVALSISWGRAEDEGWWTVDGIDRVNDLLSEASGLGITICVASGDDGWKNQVDDAFAHVDFPSSSPFVMGVGGTMLKKSKSGGAAKEIAWREDPVTDKDGEKYGGGATGGGVSRYFPRPAWQNFKIKSLNKKSLKGRVVPDVSALAGKPYYDLVFLGLPWSAGKTSASAPVWAALIARMNAKLPLKKRQRFLTPLLYKKIKGRFVGKIAFRDITTGNNAVNRDPGKCYQASKGYDAVTGWGVPDGRELLKCLKKL